jgi:predicted nucleic acid-binding protein
VTRLRVVCDASALIALQDIGQLELVAPLFAACIIPPAVDREIAPTVQRPSWVSVEALSRPIDPRVASAPLDPGESEALSLALELGNYEVVVDERPARRTAEALGLSVVGTVGILIHARQAGLLLALRPSLEALRATGFFMSDDLIDLALRKAGETTS